MSTTVTPGRFTRLPDEYALQATVVALHIVLIRQQVGF